MCVGWPNVLVHADSLFTSARSSAIVNQLINQGSFVFVNIEKKRIMLEYTITGKQLAEGETKLSTS